MRDHYDNNRGITTLLSDAVNHMTSLVRNEIALAKAEVKYGANKAATAVALLIAAVVIAVCALNVLTLALVALVASFGIATGWASLIVGVVYLLVVWALVAKAMSNLKPENLAPRRTARNAREDIEAVKEITNA